MIVMIIIIITIIIVIIIYYYYWCVCKRDYPESEVCVCNGEGGGKGGRMLACLLA